MAKDDLPITPEELEYMDEICSTILEKIPPEDIDKLGIATVISMADSRLFRSMILTLIAQGYMLRDEIDMGKSHHFNIDDILKG